MANTYKNIVITPNRSSNTADPKVVYSGGNTTANTDITLNVYPDSNGTLSWEGSAGQLFSITNDLSNNLFGVNDVSGIPSLEVYANGLVSIAPISGNVGIRNTSPSHTLSINGDLFVNTVIQSGNSTANLVANSTIIKLANATSTANIIPTGLQVFTNSTVNSTVSASLVQVSNSTSTANLSALDLKIGSTTVVNSTQVTSTLFVGNVSGTYANITGQVNTATLYAATSANIASIVQANSLGIHVGGNNYINTTALDIGNTVITSVLTTLGGQINANGSVGTAGQMLTSGAAGNVYWSTPQIGDITAVTAGNGLTGGGTSGDVTLDVGAANGITVAADTVGVLANSGLLTNTTGVHVLANTGIVANSTGTFVNATYIGTLSANNASFLGGTAAASYQLNSTLNANIASYLPTYTGVVNGSSYTVGTSFTANSTLTNTVSLVVSTNTATIGTGTYFVSNGNVGIGTSTPATKLTVNPKVSDDNAVAYDSNTVYFTHQTPTSSTTLNDPKPVLLLARQGTGGQAYGAAAEFNLSRYENVSVNSRTRLDIRLADGSFLTNNTTVLTLLSSGNVGIGNTAPNAKLQVTGTANVSGNVAIAGITTLSTNVVLGTTTITANGGVGTAGQVLTSGAAGNVYWSTPQIGDITAVTAGNGLTGGGTSGDVTLDVGAANGITVAADTVGVLANSGLLANTTGVHVLANTGIVANSTGTFVNATYIGTLSANNASFLGGTAAASYATTSQLASYLPLAGGTLTGRVIQSASGFGVGTDDTINSRIDSGFWQTSNAQTSTGWPETTATWYHLITSTHSNDGNYYSMQFAGSFFDSNALYYRATNNSGTTAWNKLWHAGNDGSGSGLDADTVDGLNPSTTSGAASRIVVADPNGYIFNNYFNSTDDVSSGTISYIMAKFGDNYYRSATAAKVASFLASQSFASPTLTGTVTVTGTANVSGNVTIGNTTFGNTFITSHTGMSNPQTFTAGVLQTSATLNTVIVGPYTVASGNSLIITAGSRLVIL